MCKETVDTVSNILVYSTLLLSEIDDLEKPIFRHQLKNVANRFKIELHKAIDDLHGVMNKDDTSVLHVYDSLFLLLSKVNGLSIMERADLVGKWEQIKGGLSDGNN